MTRVGQLREIADVIMGQSPQGAAVNRIGLGLPLLNGPTEFTDRYPEPVQWTTASTKVAKCGDTLFCVRGSTTGRMNLADQTYCVGRGIAAIRARSGSDPRFVYYALGHGLRDLLAGVTGSVFPNLSSKQIANAAVTVPDSQSQRAIAEVLGALDDKIAANRAADGAATSLSETLFAKACEAPGMRKLPLLDCIHLKFGEPFSGGFFTSPGMGRPLIRIRDLKTHSCQVWTSERRVAESVITPGDVVAGMDAEFRPSYWLGMPGVLNQRCLTADSDLGGRAFALEALKAPLGRIEGSKSATTVIHLNKADLLRERVSVPDLAELRQFSTKGEALRLQRVALARENSDLAQLRDALLPHLMSGRITVRQAELLVDASG